MTADLNTLAGQPVPTLTFDEVFHVGTLNAEDKQGSQSHEGGGLSVSLHPEHWEIIARLAGGDYWSLTRPDHAFLDYNALTDDQFDGLIAWAVERGYMEPVTAYRVTYEDLETEQPVSHLFLDLEDAEDEADENDGGLTTVDTYIFTAAFPDPTVRTGDWHDPHLLATVWVTETTNLDGVWWDRPYNLDVDEVTRDSRNWPPLGVIRADRLGGWSKRITQPATY